MPLALRVIVSGCATGILFAFFFAGGLNGLPWLYAPLVPVTLLGLFEGTVAFRRSAIISIVVVTLGLSTPAGEFLAVMLLLPLWVLLHGLLQRQSAASGVFLWRPVLWSLCDVTLVAIGIFLVVDIGVQGSGHGSLQQVLMPYVEAEFKRAGPNFLAYANAPELLRELVPLVLMVMAWVGVGCFMLLLVSGNGLLARYGRALRPELGLTLAPLPRALLALVATCVLLLIWGTPNAHFSAEVVLLFLLLPYFCYGAAWMNQVSLGWGPYRLWWLTLFYASIPVLQFLPAIALISIAFWHQFAEMLDKRA